MWGKIARAGEKGEDIDCGREGGKYIIKHLRAEKFEGKKEEYQESNRIGVPLTKRNAGLTRKGKNRVKEQHEDTREKPIARSE